MFLFVELDEHEEEEMELKLKLTSTASSLSPLHPPASRFFISLFGSVVYGLDSDSADLDISLFVSPRG